MHIVGRRSILIRGENMISTVVELRQQYQISIVKSRARCDLLPIYFSERILLREVAEYGAVVITVKRPWKKDVTHTCS